MDTEQKRERTQTKVEATTDLYGRSRLADPQQQRAVLAAIDRSQMQGDFARTLAVHQWQRLQPSRLEIFQINLGKLCNMTCSHCHVDAGPTRTTENMDRSTIDACLQALDRTDAHTVDLTGGAPELNPNFRHLVEQCVARGKHVIDRCNLTVLLLPRMQDLPAWLGERGVEIVCSLPHYQQPGTDAQRGDGTFEKSIEALQRLNAVGYGKGDPQRQLVLVTNPLATCLAKNNPCIEKRMESRIRAKLRHYLRSPDCAQQYADRALPRVARNVRSLTGVHGTSGECL